MDEHMITVKDLKRMLEAHDEDTKIDFYPLSFSCFETNSDNTIKIKYNPEVFRDETGGLVELTAIPQQKLMCIAERLSVMNSQDNKANQ